MRSSEVVCPYCGNAECNAEYVDIGVGLQQATPHECGACGAVELSAEQLFRGTEFTPAEMAFGWARPIAGATARTA
jgi:hypothetical protein